MPRWQWAKQVLRGRKREVPAPSIHTELRLFTWESKELPRSLSPGSSPRFIPRTGTPSAGTARLPHPKNTANSPLLPQHHPTFGAAPRNTRVIYPEGTNSVCHPCPLSPGHAVSHACCIWDTRTSQGHAQTLFTAGWSTGTQTPWPSLLLFFLAACPSPISQALVLSLLIICVLTLD